MILCISPDIQKGDSFSITYYSISNFRKSPSNFIGGVFKPSPPGIYSEISSEIPEGIFIEFSEREKK